MKIVKMLSPLLEIIAAEIDCDGSC